MNNYFYNKLNNKNYSQDFLASIEQFANNNKIQIYVLSNPLTDNKYLYSYQYAYIILTPKKKITFVQSSNDSKDKDAFEDYMDDVKLDIASISDKFDFREHLVVHANGIIFLRWQKKENIIVLRICTMK